MPKKYFCEYCGQTFHTPMGPAMCSKLPVCRGMNNPPLPVLGSFKVRACAVVLARTSGDMLRKSPAARSCVRTQKMGERIISWSDRAYRALEANTPISLGKASSVQLGLSKFVSGKLWTNRQGIPNLYLLELAAMYADAAKEFVHEKIESGQHMKLWVEDEHPKWLLYDAVSMPLAAYIGEMKKRRQTTKKLDSLIVDYGSGARTMGQPSHKILEDMLDHCWRDELRSWRFLEGALGTAARYIENNGTQRSKDLSSFNPAEAFNTLFDYIWGDEEAMAKPAKPAERPMKIWLVGDRFWVAARDRKEARSVLRKDTGHVANKVIGVDPKKKVYDKRGLPAGTAGDMLVGVAEPQFIGVE